MKVWVRIRHLGTGETGGGAVTSADDVRSRTSVTGTTAFFLIKKTINTSFHFELPVGFKVVKPLEEAHIHTQRQTC